jgi:formate hydrogenlyase subunit 4
MLLSGIDKNLAAKIQKRISPPLFEPFYDFLKLIRKGSNVQTVGKRVFIVAPVIALISLVIVSLFIPIFNFNAFSGVADIVVILYLLMIPAVILILARTTAGSQYTGAGVSREVISITSYELPFIIILITIGKKVGIEFNGGAITFSLEKVIQYQAMMGPMITHWSMIPAMLGMLLLIPWKAGSLPYDAKAGTEIWEGPIVVHGEKVLGIFKLNHSIKMYIMSSLFVTLFLSGTGTGIIIVDILIQVLFCIVVVIISISLIKVIIAKIKVGQALRFYWTYPTALAIISLVLVWLGL